ncbi:protein BREAST CANCER SUSCEPTIBILITY 1 homolog isoform X1 [Neltuma alba]|uniref:protein BREAST CANCER SUSCEPTIBILITY 1 homolog isoform X1 n=1 Tax=Neltuma alba TaxID=207710 RepID=UPI0010A4909C|nr:protein BREAST CANCER SUSCEPTIBILITY 1 homolog isoform X1 [Prosopis alba]
MGDPTHLEQMGKELKCPICWSLLDSAVSLTCNHVFCNSCIVKSMKSGSSCPVCKLPFRRREIRAAPHMDSLVSIYKSMEVSSGVNIFVTQNVPGAKLSDGEKQCDGDTNCGDKVAGDTYQNHSETRQKRKRKGSRKETEANKKNSGADSVKPTFPAKKRVQVPQSPLSKTPFKNAGLEPSPSEIIKKGRKEGLATSNGRPVRNEKEEVALSPFFWLRDEKDGEKSSQDTVGGKVSDTPTPNLPSFSDLRDSDDENSSKATPSVDVQDTNFVDLFDSEMFEWTQRPCSPELCSSPFRMQVEDTGEVDENQVKDYVPDSLELEANKLGADNTEFESLKQGNDLNTKTPGAASLQKKSRKRGRKATEKPQKEQTEKNGASVNGTDFIPERLPKVSHEQTWDNKRDSSNQGRTNRRGKQEHEKNYNVKNSKKSQGRRAGKQKLDNLQKIVEDPSSMQNRNNEHAGHQLSSLQMDNNGKPFSSRQIEISSGRKSNSCNRGLRNNKRLKVSSDCISQQAHDEETQPTERIHQHPESGVLSESFKEKHHPGTDVVLRKCETHIKKFQCAFCLSSEESEASGQMVHYYKGKPVAADHEGGSKVIHSHRNCTEWAPNVYFEDDIAINLEAETSRSRRIKCSFCGLKGAALGCFEKTCRRSFHVTCAKYTSQCRWDMDNFVMLCPPHASLKLPCDSTGTQNRSKKCTARDFVGRGNQRNTAGKNDTAQNLNARGSYKKVVLCCSALSGPERDVVSEFERGAKVTVLKKWDASVTHVIASTDENGACKRTLKVLLGILEGKWILNVEWIKASMQAMEPVDEERYEINVDIHGIQDGPRLGRLRVLNKQPKLFDGYKFYFMGDFMPSYKGYLQDLVTAAGGIFLHRKPLCRDQKASLSPDMHPPQTFIIYSLELPEKFGPLKRETILSQRRNDAEALARSTGSKAASNTWILNSIAACRLQSLVE